MRDLEGRVKEMKIRRGEERIVCNTNGKYCMLHLEMFYLSFHACILVCYINYIFIAGSRTSKQSLNKTESH